MVQYRHVLRATPDLPQNRHSFTLPAMKSLLAVACLLGAWVVPSLKAAEGSGPTTINVVTDYEVTELAAAYTQASSNLSRLVTLVIQRNGQRQSLGGVKSIRAQGAVLVVEVGKGAVYLINPKDVLYVTDDPAAQNN